VKQKSIRGLSVKVTGLGIMAHQNSTMTIIKKRRLIY